MTKVNQSNASFENHCSTVVTILVLCSLEIFPRVLPSQYRPVLIGDMSSSGNFTALCLHQFGVPWRLKLNAQVSSPSVWLTWCSLEGILYRCVGSAVEVGGIPGHTRLPGIWLHWLGHTCKPWSPVWQWRSSAAVSPGHHSKVWAFSEGWAVICFIVGNLTIKGADRGLYGK